MKMTKFEIIMIGLVTLNTLINISTVILTIKNVKE